MKKVLYVFCIMLLISSILISSYFIYKELKENKKQENNFEELIEIVEQTNPEDKEQVETVINIDNLYAINSDIVGWLRINDTTINYPIMQIKSNPNYYLHRDFYKKYSSYGTPYMSEECNINTSDNLVIYGHHMNHKKVFGALENYKSKEFYENHKVIEFTTLEEMKKYEIFAVFKTVVYSKNTFKYYNSVNFSNEDEFNTFVNKCKELSFYETNIKPKYHDKFITLSTCEYSNKNGRLVVIARKIDN